MVKKNLQPLIWKERKKKGKFKGGDVCTKLRNMRKIKLRESTLVANHSVKYRQKRKKSQHLSKSFIWFFFSLKKIK
jgi:hypothetical protein